MSQQGWNPKPSVLLPAKNIRNKVNVKLEETDNLILGQGVRVRVYRSTYCPNVKSIDGAEHEIDCSLCNGAQFVDRFPLETTAFIQSQALESKHLIEGVHDGNTVAATFMRGVELQYFTLVELMDFTDIYIQRVKRQTGNVDVLKYKALRVNLLEDSTGKIYTEGSDYQLDLNGNIRWCPNKGPDPKTIYSIHYEFCIRFRAIKAMHVNRFNSITTKEGEAQVKINEQWLLEKDFLVERKDINGNLLEKNKIRDSDED
jgi:hypothetical protein